MLIELRTPYDEQYMYYFYSSMNAMLIGTVIPGTVLPVLYPRDRVHWSLADQFPVPISLSLPLAHFPQFSMVIFQRPGVSLRRSFLAALTLLPRPCTTTSACFSSMTHITERSGGTITVSPKNEADQSGLVVICHGLGDTAEGFADVAEVSTSECMCATSLQFAVVYQPVLIRYAYILLVYLTHSNIQTIHATLYRNSHKNCLI